MCFPGEAMFAFKTKPIFRERNTIFLEMITCDLSVYTIDHLDLPVIVCSFLENSIGPKWVKCEFCVLIP